GVAAAGTADDLVVNERAVADGEERGGNIADGAGLNRGPGHAEGLIVGQHVVGEGQGAAGVQDAAASRAADNSTVGDRQPGDGDRHPAADTEDPALEVAADGQAVGAGAVDRQAVGDAQLTAGQRDGAGQSVGEGDGVGPGQGIGVEDRLAQRTGAAVVEVHDGEGAGDHTVLQG